MKTSYNTEKLSTLGKMNPFCSLRLNLRPKALGVPAIRSKSTHVRQMGAQNNEQRTTNKFVWDFGEHIFQTKYAHLMNNRYFAFGQGIPEVL